MPVGYGESANSVVVAAAVAAVAAAAEAADAAEETVGTAEAERHTLPKAARAS